MIKPLKSGEVCRKCTWEQVWVLMPPWRLADFLWNIWMASFLRNEYISCSSKLYPSQGCIGVTVLYLSRQSQQWSIHTIWTVSFSIWALNLWEHPRGVTANDSIKSQRDVAALLRLKQHLSCKFNKRRSKAAVWALFSLYKAKCSL